LFLNEPLAAKGVGKHRQVGRREGCAADEAAARLLINQVEFCRVR